MEVTACWLSSAGCSSAVFQSAPMMARSSLSALSWSYAAPASASSHANDSSRAVRSRSVPGVGESQPGLDNGERAAVLSLQIEQVFESGKPHFFVCGHMCLALGRRIRWFIRLCGRVKRAESELVALSVRSHTLPSRLDVIESRIHVISVRHTCQVSIASTDLSITLRFGAMCSISALTFEMDSSSSFNALAEPS